MLGLTLHAAARGQAATAPGGGFLNHTEVALVYDYIRSESVGYDGGPGTFSLSGVSAAAAYRFRPHLSAVLDFSGTHVNGVENSGASLTMLISQVGGRYTIRPVFHVTPFVQVLAGEVHATGGVYPSNAYTGGGADTYAMTAGVGGDYSVSSLVAFRAQMDYLYTGLPNGANNRQNDFRAGAGVVIRFGGR